MRVIGMQNWFSRRFGETGGSVLLCGGGVVALGPLSRTFWRPSW